MKSRNRSSSLLSTDASDFVPGRRRLPLPLTKGRAVPVASVLNERNPKVDTALTEEEFAP